MCCARAFQKGSTGFISDYLTLPQMRDNEISAINELPLLTPSHRISLADKNLMSNRLIPFFLALLRPAIMNNSNKKTGLRLDLNVSGPATNGSSYIPL